MKHLSIEQAIAKFKSGLTGFNRHYPLLSDDGHNGPIWMWLNNLMNILCGKVQNSSGKISISGHNTKMAATSGYSLQFKTMKRVGLMWLFDWLYTRWFAEALCIFFLYDSCELSPVSNVYMTDASAEWWDYTLNRVELNILYAISSVVGLRVIAFFTMVLLQRDKQK